MNKNIVIIILSTIVVLLGAYIIVDKLCNGETNYAGTYVFKSNTDQDASFALKLNENNTAILYYNMCNGWTSIQANYEVSNGDIVLSNLVPNDSVKDTITYQLNGRTNLKFTIVSDDEMYLNSDNLGCNVAGNSEGTLVKNYKNDLEYLRY